MAKETKETDAPATETKAAAKEPSKEPKKAKSGYTVVHGSFIVGKGETRKVGQQIAESEISTEEAERFIADGSLKRSA